MSEKNKELPKEDEKEHLEQTGEVQVEDEKQLLEENRDLQIKSSLESSRYISNSLKNLNIDSSGLDTAIRNIENKTKEKNIELIDGTVLEYNILNEVSWEEIEKTLNDLNAGLKEGESPWRIPTRKELRLLGCYIKFLLGHSVKLNSFGLGDENAEDFYFRAVDAIYNFYSKDKKQCVEDLKTYTAIFGLTERDTYWTNEYVQSDDTDYPDQARIWSSKSGSIYQIDLDTKSKLFLVR